MTLTIRTISKEDSPILKDIILSASQEFGAIGPGFGSYDKEMSDLFHYYSDRIDRIYLSAFWNDSLVGGCGIAPLFGDVKTCELKKLFLLPVARGRGIGEALVSRCLQFAQSTKYEKCYLETLASMTSAVALYRKMGFRTVEDRLGCTGHTGCSVYMLLNL